MPEYILRKSLDGAVDHLMESEHFVDDLFDVGGILSSHHPHQTIDALLEWTKCVFPFSGQTLNLRGVAFQLFEEALLRLSVLLDLGQHVLALEVLLVVGLGFLWCGRFGSLVRGKLVLQPFYLLLVVDVQLCQLLDMQLSSLYVRLRDVVCHFSLINHAVLLLFNLLEEGFLLWHGNAIFFQQGL